MSARSMNMIWLRLEASSALPIQLRAALVISPPATMNASVDQDALVVAVASLEFHGLSRCAVGELVGSTGLGAT